MSLTKKLGKLAIPGQELKNINNISSGVTMTTHSHTFVETYNDLVGFGLNRETDENTIIYYLQKFSDDALIQTLVARMTDDDLEEIFSLINRILKKHLSEPEYHRLFLKDDHH